GAGSAWRRPTGRVVHADRDRVDRGRGAPRAVARVGRLRPRRHHAARPRYPRECHRLPAGYPPVRLVTLLSLRHHLLAAAAVGAPRTGELALARGVWAALPDHAVVILDRGFCSYALFHALSDPTRDRHWLVRARDGRKAVRQQVVEHF